MNITSATRIHCDRCRSDVTSRLFYQVKIENYWSNVNKPDALDLCELCRDDFYRSWLGKGAPNEVVDWPPFT
jgi:hypothetical protein